MMLFVFVDIVVESKNGKLYFKVFWDYILSNGILIKVNIIKIIKKYS